MKLNRASVYAVRALVYLARHSAEGFVSAEQVAAAEGLPQMFVGKILGQLGSVGAVRSVKGPHGGCRLARPAKGITLLEVVEAVEGPVRGGMPSWTTAPADRDLDALLQAVCDDVAELVRQRLGEVTLASLAAKGRPRRTK